MRTIPAIITALLISPGIALGSDPSQAIGEARAAIEHKEYQRASDILHAAIPDALAIADGKTQNEALSAIHFYRAVALSDMGDDGEARAELAEFFRLHPGKSAIDPRKFPAHFIELFRVENVRATSMGADATAFDQQYPGFDAVEEPHLHEPPLESWAMTAAFQLLATDDEQDAWRALQDDASRAKFIEAFWQRRDPDPATPENEWRDEFMRRVAFADAVFGSGNDVARGSFTDRGKVFVLLGKPARVYREPIQYNFGAYQGLNGTAERWVYSRQQLPAKLPVREVDFRFIDQPGYGDHALLRDVMVLQALENAKIALAR